MSAAVILALIFGGLAIAVSGPALGEALQERRREGQPHLTFPGRNLFAWPAYLDPDRYTPAGRRFIVLLILTQFVLPIGFLVVWMSLA